MSNETTLHECIIRLTYRDGTRRVVEYQLTCGHLDDLLGELQTRDQVTKIEVFANVKNVARYEEWRATPIK